MRVSISEGVLEAAGTFRIIAMNDAHWHPVSMAQGCDRQRIGLLVAWSQPSQDENMHIICIVAFARDMSIAVSLAFASVVGVLPMRDLFRVGAGMSNAIY